MVSRPARWATVFSSRSPPHSQQSAWRGPWGWGCWAVCCPHCALRACPSPRRSAPSEGGGRDFERRVPGKIRQVLGARRHGWLLPMTMSEPARFLRRSFPDRGERNTRAALASFPLHSHDKRVTRAPPATGVLTQRAALDEIPDVTVGRVLRALGELGVFGCRELSLEAVE